jgi:hypothetical protein
MPKGLTPYFIAKYVKPYEILHKPHFEVYTLKWTSPVWVKGIWTMKPSPTLSIGTFVTFIQCGDQNFLLNLKWIMKKDKMVK